MHNFKNKICLNIIQIFNIESVHRNSHIINNLNKIINIHL